MNNISKNKLIGGLLNMKKIRNCISDTYISSKSTNLNFSHNSFLFLGNDNTGIFKSIIRINLDEIYKIHYKYKLKKVELCMYLEDIKHSDMSEKPFIVNIKYNLTDININTVSFVTLPRVTPINNRYRILETNIGKYMNFDITYLINEWIYGEKTNFGITLTVDDESYLAAFHSTRNKMKPFIQVSYSKENIEKLNYNYCNSNSDSNSNSNSEKVEIYYEDKFEELKYEESQTVNQSNMKTLSKLCKEEIMNELKVNMNLSREKSYGSFFNISGTMIKLNKNNNVFWDTLGECRNLKLCEDGISIIIENKGIYKIDHYINIRSENITTMEITQNEISIPNSIIQVGGTESPSFGSVIVNVLNDFSKINLIINSENIMLASIGQAAAILIVEI